MWNFLEEQWFPVALFLISTYISYWFWENPIDIGERKKKIFRDGDVSYISAVNHRGWIVRKRICGNSEKQLPFKFCATIKNNPTVQNAPASLDELKKLNYIEQ